jgi:hypothetical protein
MEEEIMGMMIMTAENPNWRQQCLPGRDHQRVLPEENERVR